LLSKKFFIKILLKWEKRIYGTEATTRQYYYKAAKDLILNEAANIITCLPNPKMYTLKPQSHFVASKSQWILRQVHNIESDPDVEALTEQK
jgi:monofunctional glycosyltransferase